jgi:Arc/MetJ family transcription regulator
MATNLAIDDELICAAKELGHHRTKRAAVEAALDEYVRRRRLERAREVAGTIDFDPDFDFREFRNRDIKRIPRDLDVDADAG